MEFPFQLVPPCSLALSLDTTEKSLDPSSILPPHQALIHIWKIPLNLLFYRLGSPSSHLSLFDGCSKAWTILVVLCWTLSMSVSYWGVQNQTAPDVSPWAEQRGRIISLDMVAVLHPTAATFRTRDTPLAHVPLACQDSWVNLSLSYLALVKKRRN